MRRLTADDVAAAAELLAAQLERRAEVAGRSWPLVTDVPAVATAAEALRPHLPGGDDDRAAWVVDGPGGSVRAVCAATFSHVGPDDPRSTYLPPSSATVPASLVADGSAADAEQLFPDLLEGLVAEARARDVGRVSVQVPAGEVHAGAVWRGLALVPDVVMAVAPTGMLVRRDLGQPTVRVRPATADDVEALTDLALEEHLFHAQHTRTGTRTDQRRSVSRGVAQRAVRPDREGGAQLVATAGGDDRVLGCLDVDVHDVPAGSPARFTVPSRYGYVGLTSVTASDRGRGVGSALVRAAAQWLSDQRVGLVVLHYVDDNPLSRRFWSSRGFAPATEILTRRL